MNIPTSTDWRVACLRGLALAPDGPHALVLISAGQYLRVPLALQDWSQWQASMGHRVWVDSTSSPLRMRSDPPRAERERRHA